MTAPIIFALLGIAIATGALIGLTGASGMSILISGLLLVGMEIREIIALTFVVTFANGVSSAIPYARRGFVNYRLLASVGLPAAIAVYPGYLLGDRISESLLKWTILSGLLLAGIKLLWKPQSQSDQVEEAASFSAPKEIATGCLFGIAMGILGGGGGIFITVTLLLLIKLQVKEALGTSIAIMTVAAIPGCLLHGSNGLVPWSTAAIIIPVSIFVAFFAARFGRKIPETYVRRWLGVYLVIIFFIMLSKELS